MEELPVHGIGLVGGALADSEQQYYPVQSTVESEQCTVHIVQYTVYSVQSIAYCVQCVYSIHFSLDTVDCTLYFIMQSDLILGNPNLCKATFYLWSSVLG